MPCYTFYCGKCKKNFDCYLTIANRNNPQLCGCGNEANRDTKTELNTMTDFNSTCKSNGRWSWGMGCHVNQISEMERKFPGSKYHPKTGQLWIESRQDKLKKAKERNLIELD